MTATVFSELVSILALASDANRGEWTHSLPSRGPVRRGWYSRVWDGTQEVGGLSLLVTVARAKLSSLTITSSRRLTANTSSE